MALKSTVFKVRLNVSDLDRNMYDDFSLSLARHPSETDERMMLRLAVFALHADPRLGFGRGISTDDEPDLWRKDLTGVVEQWIELGTPDPDRLRKACGRSGEVLLYGYGERSLAVWHQKHGEALGRLANLTMYGVRDDALKTLGDFARPGMELQCSISGGELWLTDGHRTLELKPFPLGT